MSSRPDAGPTLHSSRCVSAPCLVHLSVRQPPSPGYLRQGPSGLHKAGQRAKNQTVPTLLGEDPGEEGRERGKDTTRAATASPA